MEGLGEAFVAMYKLLIFCILIQIPFAILGFAFFTIELVTFFAQHWRF